MKKQKQSDKTAEKKTNTKKDNKKAAVSTLNDTLSMHEKFANLYVISMFTLFPVFMTDMLFNVRQDRLHYFIASTLVFLFFLIATYVCGIDRKKWPKNIFKMAVEDWAMIGFLAVNIISTMLSEYGMEAVTGEKGRDSGLILMAVYVLCYFLVSRYYKYRLLPYNIFVITSCIICLIAVLHEFYSDPFKIIVDIRENQSAMFISTIGNINIFSCFVCIAMPVITALLVSSRDLSSTIFYCIATGISFMGLLVANSDSGYFGLVAFMAVLFVYSCGSAERLFRFILSVLSMLISCKVLRLISLMFGDNYKALDTIPETLIFNSKIYILIALVAVIAFLFYMLKRKLGELSLPKGIQIAAGAFVALCAASVLGVFVYFSAIDTTTDLGSLEKYLRLNDQWGTHRGYAWIRSIILFKSNGLKNMLVGSGPDTFGQIIKKYYREDMIQRHNSVFDSAHNEYLTYLVTIGFLGVAAYITALVSVIVKGARRFKNSTALLIITLVIISYCSQAMFNIFTPIVTPYLFLFLGLGAAVIRSTNAERDLPLDRKKDVKEGK